MFSERTKMLKAAGITAEYNPLHNGHVYHIEETRRITGCDAVIVAMSGDYMQRGEPAFMDKWTRTGHALKNGADLVIEIPVLFCLSDAGQYAGAAVKLLEATGKVSHISFGSESGDIGTLTRIADMFRNNTHEIEEAVKEIRGMGFSFPAARDQAYTRIMTALNGSDPDSGRKIENDLRVLKKANDILGFEYIRAMRTAEPVAVHREGAGYGDAYDEHIVYQSASAIRAQTFSGGDMSGYVPECTAESMRECHLSGPDKDIWFELLRYAVLSTDEETIEDCPSGGEGLASLMKACAGTAESWSAFVRRLKSKRYTYTRLSRLCMQLVLGITRSRYDMDGPEYIRVLGFSDTGRKLLAEMRDEGTAALPVIINVNKNTEGLSRQAEKQLRLDMHAADIYNLVTKGETDSCSDRRHQPVMTGK